jgi:hypothetical protein
MKKKSRNPPSHILFGRQDASKVFSHLITASKHTASEHKASEQAMAFWRMAMAGSRLLYTSSACDLKEQDNGFGTIHVHVWSLQPFLLFYTNTTLLISCWILGPDY